MAMHCVPKSIESHKQVSMIKSYPILYSIVWRINTKKKNLKSIDQSQPETSVTLKNFLFTKAKLLILKR